MFRRELGIQAILAVLGITMKDVLPPPPDRPGLGATFKRPVSQITIPNGAGFGQARIVIGGNLPAPLDTYHFFSGAGPRADAGIIFYQGDGTDLNFNFIVHVSSGAGTFIYIGAVKAGAVVESHANYPAGSSWAISTPGLGSSLVHHIDGSDFFTITYDSAGNFVSAPRTALFATTVSAAFNTPAAVGEVEAFTTGNIVIKALRAYRISLTNAKLKSAAAQNPAINLRKSNGLATGTLYVTGPRWPITVLNIDIPFNPSFIIINTTTADVTTNLALTINPSVATAVTLDAGAGSAVWGLDVVDIGDHNMYTGFPAV